MTDPVDPGYEPDEFSDLRSKTAPDDFDTLRHPSAPPPAPAGPGLVERLQTSVADLDPRLVVGVGIGALALVTLVGLVVLFNVARSRIAKPEATQVMLVTANPTPPPGTVNATATLTPLASTSGTPGASVTAAASATGNTVALQFATLSEVKGDVQIRTTADGPWTKVTDTIQIVPGTTILTGENSSVKVQLSQGPIVRLSSQTQFTLSDISGDANRMHILLNLDFGKLWAIVQGLGEGTFEIQMPQGVAAVRGTYMSAEHNTTDQIEIVTCLEGRCGYQNKNGRVQLVNGQQTESINGGLPTAPHPMDAGQLAAWALKNIPEVASLTPTATPTRTKGPTNTTGPTATKGPSTTPTRTPTVTLTGTVTRTPTITPTITPTYTGTVPTNTPSPTRTVTRTFTPTPTFTNTPPATNTPTVSPTVTLTYTPTITDTPTFTATVTDTPTNTAVPTDTPTATFTPPPTVDHLAINCGTSTGVGAAVSCTVTAQDISNNTVTTYTGPVSLSTNDTSAAVPGTYGYSPSDLGVHTFSITFNTSNTAPGWTVSASDGTYSGGPATVSVP